jgi:hypothetical protein
LRGTAIGLAHAEWQLLAVLATALVLALVGSLLFIFAESKDLLAAKLIGGDAPLRNLFELLYFISQCALLGVALVALIFAGRQAREAENARLVSVYAQLEERWSSAQMLGARRLFREIMSKHQAYAADRQNPPMELAAYFDREMIRLGTNDVETYLNVLALADYLEFIGMLEDNGYVDIDDLEALMGELCVAVHDIMAVHIDAVRNRNRNLNARSGYVNVPDAYVSFSRLAGKFAARFRAPRGA